MINKEKKIYPGIYIFSFLIPIIIAALAYFNIQIFPGSVNTLLIYDMKGELLPTYRYLSNPGPGYDSLFHTMSGALGGGLLGRFAHVLSLFDIIYKFVPATVLPDAIYFVTLFKIGLCGLFMSVFLSSRHRKDTGSLCIILFSSCYALMSYIFIYALWPLWMDLVMLFPLLALSVEKIIAGKKTLSFILLVSLGMISDYHIAYMSIIALTLYFFFRLTEEGIALHVVINRALSYMIHGIISAGLSSFILFPVAYDLMMGKMSASAEESSMLFIKNTPLDVLKSFIPGSFSTLHSNASPNIFCGSVVVFFSLVWFGYGRKELRARIGGAVVVLIYFISFIFGPLDRIWHGFRDPVGFSVRYSFTFVFFMICFAVRGFIRLRQCKIKMSPLLRYMITVILPFFTAVELFINGSYNLARLSVDVGYTNRNEYLRFNEFMTELVDEADLDSGGEYYRLYKDFNFSSFDGALYGYDGLFILDSSLNPVFVSFLSDIGIGASYRVIVECGITPPTASLFDFKYFISSNSQSDCYEKIGECNHHYLFRNQYALPLIFGTSYDPQNELRTFTGDPFENINSIYSDFLGEKTEVFVKQNYEFSKPSSDKYHSEYTAGAADLRFSPDEEGVFWLYSDYVRANDDIWIAPDEFGFSVVPIYAYVFLDDEKIGSFRDALYSYCNEIGVLDQLDEVKVSLDTSYSELKNIYIYRYDEAALAEASKAINEKGFAITYIGDKGIKAEGNMAEDGYVYISLPYNPGYSVYVDGEKSDYTSYRDTFMLIAMSAGKHQISIKYIPCGLRAGLVVSLIFLVLLIIYMRNNVNNSFFKKNIVKHP